MLINDLYTNKKPNLSEGMEGQVVFSGTGADGSTYEIIQSSPTDFMIHANGRHIDTYGSLQRAMSVLQNEVPGLQQGVAEDLEQNVTVYGNNRGYYAWTPTSGVLAVSSAGKFQMYWDDLTGDSPQIQQYVSKYMKPVAFNTLPGQAQRVIGRKLFNQGVAEGTLDEAVGMMIKGAAISGDNDQDIADRIAAKTGGRVDSGSYGHHVLITYPTTQHRAEAAVKIRKMFPGIELYKSGGNRNAIDEQGVAKGLNEFATNDDDDDYDDEEGDDFPEMFEAPFTVVINGKKQTGTVIIYPGEVTSAEWHLKDTIYIKTGMDNVHNTSDFITHAAEYIQEIIRLDGRGHNYVKHLKKRRGVGEGSELKQAKRKYNQAAKDANNDQVGAGKKIDTMKNSLRQRDLNKQGMAEGNPVAGQDFTMKDGAQMKWNPASKSWQQQAPVPGDGFNVVSGYDTDHTIDNGNKSTGTYTSTTIAKNPTTGQQQSLASWDHTDPKTGKNYSGSNYIDPQGNAEVQKNYEESQDQLDELDKKTVASWVRQQPERIKGDTGLSRTNFKKAKRLVDKSIPSAIAKYKDPSYGKQEKRMDEVSLGDYRKKATVNKAMAQTNKFFGRDDPAAVAAADRTIAKRERGLGRADARRQPYTAPPVDQDKQRRDLADKYPNIDELVRQAELRRDPQYDRADGPAYYDGRDAEQNYHKLKQIQRMIRGAELDEMDFGVSQTTDSDTGDVTTNFNQGPMSVSQTKTPGGYTKQTDQQVNLGAATLGAKTVGPNIGAGQLAGTTTKTATNTATGQAKQQVKGVGFGGASGATVGKNYVGSSDDELAKYAADSTFGVNESVNRIRHLAGIKPAK